MITRIQYLLDGGESRHVEFKAARKALNRDIYETVCAFLNRDGGDILLGVSDTGEVRGIDPEHIKRIKQDFVNAINNPQKIYPPCYLDITEVTHEEMVLLHIVVPPVPRYIDATTEFLTAMKMAILISPIINHWLRNAI